MSWLVNVYDQNTNVCVTNWFDMKTFRFGIQCHIDITTIKWIYMGIKWTYMGFRFSANC